MNAKVVIDKEFDELVRLIDLGSKKSSENRKIIEQAFNPIDFLPNINSHNLNDNSISKRSKLDLKNDPTKPEKNIEQPKSAYKKTRTLKNTKELPDAIKSVVSKGVRKRTLHHDTNDMLLDMPLIKKPSSSLKLEESISLVQKCTIQNPKTLHKVDNKTLPQTKANDLTSININSEKSLLSNQNRFPSSNSIVNITEFDLKNLRIYSPLKNQCGNISKNVAVNSNIATETQNEKIDSPKIAEKEVFEPAVSVLTGAEETKTNTCANEINVAELHVEDTPIPTIIEPNKGEKYLTCDNSKNNAGFNNNEPDENISAPSTKESCRQNIELMEENSLNSEKDKTQQCLEAPTLTIMCTPEIQCKNDPSIDETELHISAVITGNDITSTEKPEAQIDSQQSESVVCNITLKSESEITPMEVSVVNDSDEPTIIQLEEETLNKAKENNNAPNQPKGKRGRPRKRKILPPIKTRQTPMGLPKPERPAKKKFTVEEIYTNKNYITPLPKSLETIFEFPKETKDGTLKYTERKKKIRAMYFCTNPAERIPKTGKKGIKHRYRATRSNKTNSAESDQKLSIILSTLEQRLRLNNLS